MNFTNCFAKVSFCLLINFLFSFNLLAKDSENIFEKIKSPEAIYNQFDSRGFRCESKDEFEKTSEYLNRLKACMSRLEKDVGSKYFYVWCKFFFIRYNADKEILTIDLPVKKIEFSHYDISTFETSDLFKKHNYIYVILLEKSSVPGVTIGYYLYPFDISIKNCPKYLEIPMSPVSAKKIYHNIQLVFKFRPRLFYLEPLVENKYRDVKFTFCGSDIRKISLFERHNYIRYLIGAQDIEVLVLDKNSKKILLTKKITNINPNKSSRISKKVKREHKKKDNFCSLIIQYCYEAGYEGGKDDKSRGLPCDPNDYYNLPLVKSFLKLLKIRMNLSPSQKKEFDPCCKEGFTEGYKDGYHGYKKKHTIFNE